MKIRFHTNASLKIRLTLLVSILAGAIDVAMTYFWSSWQDSIWHVLIFGVLVISGFQVAYLLGYEQRHLEHLTLRPGRRYLIAGPIQQPWVMMGLSTAADEAEIRLVSESEYARLRALGGFNS